MRGITIQNEFRLVIATSDTVYYFTPEQIVRLESRSNYTNIYFTDRKPILISKVLKIFDISLSPFGFLRTHQSHLVNVRYISAITAAGNIIMDDQSTAEISRRRKPEVLKMLREKFVRA